MLEYYDHLINRYRHRFLESRLTNLGVKNPDGFLLVRIDKQKKIKLAEVVQNLPFHKSHVSRTMLRLVESGYVEKTPDPEDLRGYIITITPKGEKVANKVMGVIREWDNLVQAALSKDELKTLETINRKILDYLADYFKEDLPDGKNA